jgi:hypothetical protein
MIKAEDEFYKVIEEEYGLDGADFSFDMTGYIKSEDLREILWKCAISNNQIELNKDGSSVKGETE